MDKKAFRTLMGLVPALTASLIVGCASTPDEAPYEPAPISEPVVAPAPEQPAEPIVVQENRPQRYVVVEGDTLWDISSKFLRDPWRWPEVWQINPQVENPHLIYPGDVLMLLFVDGQPVVVRAGADGEPVMDPTEGRVSTGKYPTVKLAPRIREEALGSAIATLPVDAIAQFLIRPYVLEEDELEDSPYVVAFADEHIAGGTDYRAYVRGIQDNTIGRYAVLRPGEEMRNEAGELLGYSALHVGDGSIQRLGDPATLLLTDTNREVLPGDRLVPTDDTPLDVTFLPRPPEEQIEASIIDVIDGVSQIAQFQVVIIDHGRLDGLEPGHVMAIYRRGEEIRDTVEGGWVMTPDERAGLLMVFRTYDRVSFALVVDAFRPIHRFDRVTNP